MDALTIASSIVQFIDFASKLVGKSVRLYNAADGQLDEHQELANITRSLSRNAENIGQAFENLRCCNNLTDAEREQKSIGIDCQHVAEELLEALDALKLGEKRTTWQSFRQALRMLWNEEKIQALERRLDRLRQQMVANVLESLR